MARPFLMMVVSFTSYEMFFSLENYSKLSQAMIDEQPLPIQKVLHKKTDLRAQIPSNSFFQKRSGSATAVRLLVNGLLIQTEW